MVNFVECLLDNEYHLPIKKYKLFKVIDDLGVRYTSYGNASGGIFTGLYRSFLVEHKKSTEIVSIGVSVYCTWARQDILKTAINVAQARGVIIVVGCQRNIPTFEYTPLQIKTAMTGFGRAEKKQIQSMVKMILNLDSVPKPDDTADALAAAICHGYSGEMKKKMFKMK